MPLVPLMFMREKKMTTNTIPYEVKCTKCGKCVSVSTKYDRLSGDAGEILTQCNELGCPIKSSVDSNADNTVYIDFIKCDDDPKAS